MATNRLNVVVLHNEPTLPRDDPDWASEAGVLESVETVVTALASRGHHVRRLGIASLSDCLEALTTVGKCDAMFNLFEGFGGVGRGEAEIAGLWELSGYSLTGSPAECLALVRHKARTKWLLAGAGLPTPEFALVDLDDELTSPRLQRLLELGAVIVKPAHEDASLGIDSESIVQDADSLAAQVARVRARYGPALVEQFVVGREFNVGVIALPSAEVLPLAEIEFSGPGAPGWQIVSYQAKWDSNSAADRATPARCPAKVDGETAGRIGRIALAAFQVTGCRDYARVDMRMDSQGRAYVLEVNGNPDIGPSAGLARELQAGGWRHDEFVERLAVVAAARSTCPPSLRSETLFTS